MRVSGILLLAAAGFLTLSTPDAAGRESRTKGKRPVTSSMVEYHVSPEGNDQNSGLRTRPLRTISAAAERAQPGDVITVHQGTYRERINPPRGGDSETRRITYRAAPGETVIIKGSEIVTGWVPVQGGVWKVTLSESFFGKYNPYRDVIAGDWFDRRGRDHHTGEVYLDGAALAEAARLDEVTTAGARPKRPLWFCAADSTSTTIWADFRGADPNKALVEINVRESCFYPDAPGRNYLTVRGFRMAHAATQWAPPTAEQPGLIGTHWSKGWIIEDNVISHSKCVGITLGKDRASGQNAAESAEGYTPVVRRALKNGWSKERIGSHIVRNNTISECGAAGICGSMGGAFSRIYGNHIHHIHFEKPFSGAEMAGIKFHGAIDTMIRDNYIHHTNLGIWLDWMSQGTRVSANLLHDNGDKDIFLEVNHGPYVVDNNLFLSPTAVHDISEGGAFAHNLFAGKLVCQTDQRQTPYHRAHSTGIAGLSAIRGGDNRFHNNIVAGHQGLQIYDAAERPVQADGNVYFSGALPVRGETGGVQLAGIGLGARVVQEQDGVNLHLTLPPAADGGTCQLVSSQLLGKAVVPQLPFVNADGTGLVVARDYFGRKRTGPNPSAGPFENPGEGELRLRVWPKTDSGESR